MVRRPGDSTATIHPQHCRRARRQWPALAVMLALVLHGCGFMTKTSKPFIRGLNDDKAALVHEVGDVTQDAPSALQRANQALQAGDRDEALYYYVKVLEFDETNREALTRIGEIHAAKGNDAAAEMAYRLVLKGEPKDAGVLAGLGMVQFRAGRRQEASESLTRAVAIDPGLWRAHNVLGMLADQRGDHGLAQQCFDKALQAQPNSAILLNNIGYSLYLTGDLRGALKRFNAALASDPQYHPAWINKGLVYARLNNEKAALDAFKHVTDEADAYNNLGYIWMKIGKTDGAYASFQKAISLSPTYHVTAHENLKRLQAMEK